MHVLFQKGYVDNGHAVMVRVSIYVQTGTIRWPPLETAADCREGPTDNKMLKYTTQSLHNILIFIDDNVP